MDITIKLETGVKLTLMSQGEYFAIVYEYDHEGWYCIWMTKSERDELIKKLIEWMNEE